MPSVPSLSIPQVCFSKACQQFENAKWVFCSNEDDFIFQLKDAEYILCWAFNKELYLKAPKLKAIFTPAAGRDWIEQDPTNRVKVYHSHFHGTLMSESLLGMITYFNNSFDDALIAQRNNLWDRKSIRTRVMLRDQHVVIVGYGSIGKKCAELLHKIGCSVTGIKRSPVNDLENGVSLAPFAKLQDILPTADHVVLILPGDESTTGLITRDHITSMKPSAVLHNMGRGNCVKEQDLVWALSDKIIKGAALDVFEQEPLQDSSKLWQLTNVLITPHSTCFYDEYGHLFADEVSEELQLLLDNFNS